MELSDIILGLVGILTTIIGWVVRNVVADINELEHNMNTCQTALPEKYVMKSDYKDDIKEIKSMLGDLYDLTRNSK